MALIGLPDTDGREFSTPVMLNVYQPSKKDLDDIMGEYGASIGATDYGSITVWLDDNGWFQCMIDRYMVRYEHWKANSFDAIYPCYKIACKLLQRR